VGLLFSIVATETSSVTFLQHPGVSWSRDFSFIQLPSGTHQAGSSSSPSSCPTTSPRVLTLRGAAQALRRRGRPGGLVPVHRHRARRRPAALPDRARGPGDGRRLAPLAVALVASPPSCTRSWRMKAVVWTDVIQFVVYWRERSSPSRPGRPPARGLGELVATGAAAASSTGSTSRPPRQPVHALGRPHRRDVPDVRLARGGPAHGPALPLRPQPRRGARALWTSGIVIVAQFAFFLLIASASSPSTPRSPGGALRPARPGLHPVHRRAAAARGDRARRRAPSSPRRCPPVELAQLVGHRPRDRFYRPSCGPTPRRCTATCHPRLHPLLRPRADPGRPRRAAPQPDRGRVRPHHRRLHHRHLLASSSSDLHAARRAEAAFVGCSWASG